MQNYASHEDSKTIPFVFLQPTASAPQIPKHVFTAQPALANRNYAELDLFKEQLAQRGGGTAKLYSRRKTQVFVYKSIFFGFAALFTFLGFLSASISSAVGCGLLGSCFIFKGFLMACSFSLAATSFSIAYKLRTEKEAVMHQVKKSLTYASKIYTHKRLRLGAKRFFAFFGADQRQVATLKQMYQEVHEKIHEKKEETLHLFNRIAASSLDAHRQELLFNQAIEELRDQLNRLNHSFRHAKS